MSNLSGEEKAIIKELKRINDKEDKVINGISPTLIANTIYLIDRLQKENEYLREREEYLEKRRSDIINTFQNKVTGTTIPKDKIKDKIKELEKECETELLTTWLEAKIEVLEELLEGE